MWSNNYLFCLFKGHASSTFTYKGVEYQYCVRCGKIEPTNAFKKNSSALDTSHHLKREAAGMLRMTNMTR